MSKTTYGRIAFDGLNSQIFKPNENTDIEDYQSNKKVIDMAYPEITTEGKNVIFAFKSKKDAMNTVTKAIKANYPDIISVECGCDVLTGDPDKDSSDHYEDDAIMITQPPDDQGETLFHLGHVHIQRVGINNKKWGIVIQIKDWRNHNIPQKVYLAQAMGYKSTQPLMGNDSKAHTQLKVKDNVHTNSIEVLPNPTESLETRLSKDLPYLNFAKGIKSFNGIKGEWDTFKNMNWDNPLNNTLIDLTKTKQLVIDLYGKGLNFILLAYEIYKQINQTSYKELQLEHDDLAQQISKIKDTDCTLFTTLNQALAKNTDLLTMVKSKQDRIDELLGQVSLCKDSILEIRLALPELLNHQAKDSVDKLVTEAKDRVGFGQRLLDEYKIQGL